MTAVLISFAVTAPLLHLFADVEPTAILVRPFLSENFPTLLLVYNFTTLVLITIDTLNILFNACTYLTFITSTLLRIIITEFLIVRQERGRFEAYVFSRSFKTYRVLQVVGILTNEVGDCVHPLLFFIGFSLLVFSGVVTILGGSALKMSSFFYPVFPISFLVVLLILAITLPAGAMIYENAVGFRSSWKAFCFGNRYFRMQLASCRELRLFVKGMGYIDRSFIMTYFDGVLNIIMGIVVYVNN